MRERPWDVRPKGQRPLAMLRPGWQAPSGAAGTQGPRPRRQQHGQDGAAQALGGVLEPPPCVSARGDNPPAPLSQSETREASPAGTGLESH